MCWSQWQLDKTTGGGGCRRTCAARSVVSFYLAVFLYSHHQQNTSALLGTVDVYADFCSSTPDAMALFPLMPRQKSLKTGEGGTLLLINGSAYPWKRESTGSYQMTSWNFPKEIKPGATFHDISTDVTGRKLRAGKEPLLRSMSSSNKRSQPLAPTPVDTAITL